MSFTVDIVKRELMNQKIERKTLCKMHHRVIIFLFLFFFWDPCSSNVGVFDIVPEVSETILSSFCFILLFRSYFHHFIFQLYDSFCFRYSEFKVAIYCFTSLLKFWSPEITFLSRICRHILLYPIQLDFMGKSCHKGKGSPKLCSCPQVRAVAPQHMSPELCPQGVDLWSLEIRDKASRCPSCSSSLLIVHLAQCWQPMAQKTCCSTRCYHVSFFPFIIDSFHSSILLWDW